MSENTQKDVTPKEKKKQYLKKACIVCYDHALIIKNKTDVKCETCGSVYPLKLLKQGKG